MNDLTPPPLDRVHCQLSMAWQEVGPIMVADDGRLTFPDIDKAPGLYRITIRQGTSREVYIGEATNLRRRFHNYRSPGPTQETSKRINKLLMKVLAEGAEVGVSVSLSATIDSGNGPEPADLSSKVVRCLVENAAILAAARMADRIHNLAQKVPDEVP
ncbi:MAG: hypothetical protein HQL42_17225 [Alphaproteobacteria bacterium]|nr:hypothetical protein [Alphaproteobacteria bacterium]